MRFTQRLRNAVACAMPQDAATAYLNEATSIVDLEGRQREIDSGRFHRANRLK
ncbi:DUF3563 family protein [Aureimonas sp. ME7]|uniref:DUF3563 family protein n=1 Tax=Aureimonas sp. ME7 TaxID=2744252 RepID=UPI001FCEE216|nr:DUF3563 family protein [Aureimonas sp. ME7]